MLLKIKIDEGERGNYVAVRVSCLSPVFVFTSGKDNKKENAFAVRRSRERQINFRKGKKKPVEPEVKENKPYLEEQYVNSFITQISEVKELVPLPPGIDLYEWIATNTLAFFNQVDLLYGSVSERCTVTSCPTMSAPGSVTYLWHDDKGKKITKTTVSAPQYIDYVMTCCHKHLHDDAVFPTKFGMTFPPTFMTTVRKLFKLLFHVQAHMYYAHFNDLLNHELQSHINTVLIHFILYHQEFNLLDPKETAPLDDLLQAMGLINQS